MTADEIVKLAANVGVPAVLAGFVLVRLDASMRALEKALTRLIERIDARLK
jgi:hypothetical protein